jgi:putative ABC transport system permease protein
MVMKKLNVRLLRNIKNSKGQFISILAVIITGLFIFVAMNNASTNLRTSLEEYYEITNFADAYVDVMKIPDNEVEEIIGREGIVNAEARVVMDVPFITDNKDEKVNVRTISVGGTSNEINKLYMEEGKRDLGPKDCIVIGQFARARGIQVGDEISIQLSGRKYELNVVGIAISPEYTYLVENEQSFMPRPEKFGIVYIEKEYLKNISNFSNSSNDVILTVEEGSDFEDLKDYIEDTWDNYGVRRVIEKENQLSNNMMYQEINGLEQISGSVPVIFLVVAGIILATMMSKNVKNDRTTIGIFKALGYTNKSIVIHYIKYALAIGIIGGIVGTLLGTLLSGFMTNMYTEFFALPLLKIQIYPMNVVIAALLSSLFCSAAGLWGAKDILKISPAQSMRRETPKSGHRILIEKVKFIWNKVTFTWKIVIRNIFREKKKFIFISLGAAFTVAMMMTTLWMWILFDDMFNVYYGEFMSMDYDISFSKTVSEDSIKDLDKLIESDRIEPNIEIPFELRNGREKKVVNIIGIKKDTEMYKFKDSNDNPVYLQDDGMLISSNLAKALDVNIGEKILIHNFLPNKDDRYVEVKGIVSQAFGINGYMDLDYMEKILVDYNAVNGAYVKSDANIIPDLEDIKNINSVMSTEEMVSIFYDYIDLMIVETAFLLIFSGTLGFVIIYSMSVMSINERKMEFSSLRVLGFGRNEIFGIISKENALMSIIGIIYGIPLGMTFIESIGNVFTTDLYTLDQPIGITQIILSIIFTVICLTAAQLATYRKISRLDFIEALKSRTT